MNNQLIIRVCTFACVQIGDLGLSKLLENASDGHATESTLSGIDRNPLWMAPEIVCHGNVQTYSSDVWSFGIILWELLTGKLPWSHIQCPKGVLVFGVRSRADATLFRYLF